MLICFHEWPAPQGEIVRGYWRRGKGSSWMETRTFLYHSRSPSPNSPCEHGQEELGRDILHQCEGLLASCTGARLVGVWKVLSCLPSASHPSYRSASFFLSHPHPLYLLFIFLHRFCILFICLSFRLISPILKGLSGEERASPSFSQLYLPNKA